MKSNKNHKDNQKKENNQKLENHKILKINDDFNSQNFIHIKKLRNIFIIILIIFILLVVRIGFLQFVEGSSLKEMAYKQQSINQIISPKRGNILDSTGIVLATSASVDTITINPKSIKDKDDNEEKTRTGGSFGEEEEITAYATKLMGKPI